MSLAKFKIVAHFVSAAGFSAGAMIFLGMVTVGAAEATREKTDLSWIDQRLVLPRTVSTVSRCGQRSFPWTTAWRACSCRAN